MNHEQEHKEERKERHPGQLAINKRNVRAVVTHEVRDLKAAVKPYVREGEKAAVEVAKQGAKLAAQDKVKIGFYMESMCPGCKYFTVKVMQDLMKKPEFRSMVDVQVYPYGNGELSGDKITCQHGADECLGNQIIACMQKKYPITESSPGFFPAFACMEAKNGKPVDEGQSCATDNSEMSPYTIHQTPHTIHPIPHNLQPTTYTQHPAPYIMHGQ